MQVFSLYASSQILGNLAAGAKVGDLLHSYPVDPAMRAQD